MARRTLHRGFYPALLATLIAGFVACTGTVLMQEQEPTVADKAGHSTRGNESATVPTPVVPASNKQPADAQAEVTISNAATATGDPRKPEGRNKKLWLAHDAVSPGDALYGVPDRQAGTGSFGFAAESNLGGLRAPSEPIDRENYAHFDDNPLRLVSENPVSTFSIDVDTGSYANVRRILNNGHLPRFDAVRVEEMINYFSYDYPVPGDNGRPFSITTEVTETPWNPATLLFRVGLKGFDVSDDERPPANLVFLIDVSGSMQSDDKLPLLKNAFRLLVKELDGLDTISMVVYAGATGVVLDPTPGDSKARILSALDQLSAGGRTNGGAGIRLAYSLAQDAYIDEGINRVILATDGDFNVGTVSFESLVDLVKERRESGISLTTLGFGTGNYNDHLLEQLADDANGNYAYIDSLREARKVLVEELTATLQTIAKDVKIQIEFNPATVAEYRLIGYENRILRREDFNNDRVDAGEIGAGHTVTALYELTLIDSSARLVDPLRYGDETDTEGHDGELAFVRLRYKLPDEDTSRLIEQPVHGDAVREADEASEDLRFTAAVAAFGQLLRGGAYLEDFEFSDVSELAESGRSRDPYGYRGEFIALVELADGLSTPDRHAAR